jgi:ribosome-associated protein
LGLKLFNELIHGLDECMEYAALDIARTVVNTLDEKKADDILLLDLIEVCSFTDYFIICSGVSERTLRALSSEAQQDVKRDYGLLAKHVEGTPESGWILIDFGDLVVHLFSAEKRKYYQLENLWQEGKVVLRVQ